jgi:acyl carrier protein
MIPSAFIMLDKLPQTSNGKVDRQALPSPETGRPELGTPFAPPRNWMEEELAKIWAEVLGLDEVGIHDLFLELGGDSLRASKLISRVLKVFRMELSMQTLLEAPTVADMAEALASHQSQGANGSNGDPAPVDQSIPLRKATGPGPLSFSQERLWILNQLEPDNLAYNMPNAFRLQGPFNRNALEKALQAIVDRHEVVRTTFQFVDDDPVQVVHPNRQIKLNEVDLSGDLADQSEEKIRQLLRAEIQRPFDLSRDLMIRATLLRLNEEDHIFLLVKHHIASDGWSSRILAREMSELYNAYARGESPSLPDLPIQYADFAEWQRSWLQGEFLEQQVSYWKERLAGSPALLALPTDRPRPARQTFRGAQTEFRFPKDLVESLKALSRQEGVTLFMTLLSGFQMLLYRYTGSVDISVGTPIAGRNRVETEGLIGFFMNILVLRTDLSKNPTFRQLLGRVQEVCLDAYAHQDLPFEKLVAELRPNRSLSHSPFFQVLFNYQSAPSKGLEFEGLSAKVMDMETGGAKFDLSLSMRESEGAMKCLVEYNTDLFDETTIGKMMDHYRSLLETAGKDLEQRISSVPLAPSYQAMSDPDTLYQAYGQEELEHLLSEVEGLSDEEASQRISQQEG